MKSDLRQEQVWALVAIHFKMPLPVLEPWVIESLKRLEYIKDKPGGKGWMTTISGRITVRQLA